ncbi:MAG: protein kinase [Myxococcota bacterium]
MKPPSEFRRVLHAILELNRKGDPPPRVSDVPSLSEALAELSGTVLEQRYRLGAILGAGGMGAVFEATHLRLDRRVAIKILRPGLSDRGEYVERFLREAKAASKIGHRNVVEIHDYGEAAGGLVYSVMAFLVGQDLEQLLRAQPEGRLPWAQAHGLLVQIATGLKAAHGCGVIHRDIKPANCFVTKEDGEPVVKLLDFGLAKLDGTEPAQQLTSTSQLLGTPSYMAPELIRAMGPASVRSDVYSLGVLAYRMLTGRVPFMGTNAFEVLRMACYEPVLPLREVVPEIPKDVEGLVLGMLAKKPEDRPADMQAVRERLLALEPAEPSMVGGGLRLKEPDEEASEGALVSEATLPSEGTATLVPAAASSRLSRRAWRWVGLLGVVVTLTFGAIFVSSMDLGGVTDPTVAGKSSGFSRAGDLEDERSPPNGSKGSVAATLGESEAPGQLEERGQPEVPGQSEESAQPEARGQSEARGQPEKPAQPATSPAGAVKRSASRKTRTPSRPPADSTLTKKLRQRIRSRCAQALGGQPITVSFIIESGGQMVGTSTDREGEVGKCTKAQVKGTKFRARDKATPVQLVVK